MHPVIVSRKLRGMRLRQCVRQYVRRTWYIAGAPHATVAGVGGEAGVDPRGRGEGGWAGAGYGTACKSRSALGRDPLAEK